MTLIPASQRRTLDELSDRLDLGGGDASAKRSAFWLMLVLSGVIPIAGVVADSTATVIGAMIIAPLSTPILGIAFGVVTGRAKVVGRSLLYVVVSVGVVVVLGAVVAQVLPNTTHVLANSQVVGRTSPTLMDLMAGCRHCGYTASWQGLSRLVNAFCARGDPDDAELAVEYLGSVEADGGGGSHRRPAHRKGRGG